MTLQTVKRGIFESISSWERELFLSESIAYQDFKCCCSQWVFFTWHERNIIPSKSLPCQKRTSLLNELFQERNIFPSKSISCQDVNLYFLSEGTVFPSKSISSQEGNLFLCKFVSCQGTNLFLGESISWRESLSEWVPTGDKFLCQSQTIFLVCATC